MANLVKQLKDKEGNNIFPLGIMGGSHTQMKLLWTNPNPTAAFAAQTVSLDLSGYDMIQIMFSMNTNTAYGKYFQTFAIDGLYSEMYVERSWSHATPYSRVAYRGVGVFTNKVEFAGGSYYNNGGHPDDNTYAIPLAIYGIKLNEQNLQGVVRHHDWDWYQSHTGTGTITLPANILEYSEFMVTMVETSSADKLTVQSIGHTSLFDTDYTDRTYGVGGGLYGVYSGSGYGSTFAVSFKKTTGGIFTASIKYAMLDGVDKTSTTFFGISLRY